MKHSSDLAPVPLILRVVGMHTVFTHTGLFGDEDALPTVVELSNDGLLLSRGTKVTEVHSETTDDS